MSSSGSAMSSAPQQIPIVASCFSDLETSVSSLGGAVDVLLARLGPVLRSEPSNAELKPPSGAASRQSRGVPLAGQVIETCRQLDRYADKVREAVALLEV